MCISTTLPKGLGLRAQKMASGLSPGRARSTYRAFLNGLKRAGYGGYIACEILAPSPVAETPDEAAALIRRALQELGL